MLCFPKLYQASLRTPLALPHNRRNFVGVPVVRLLVRHNRLLVQRKPLEVEVVGIGQINSEVVVHPLVGLEDVELAVRILVRQLVLQRVRQLVLQRDRQLVLRQVLLLVLIRAQVKRLVLVRLLFLLLPLSHVEVVRSQSVH